MNKKLILALAISLFLISSASAITIPLTASYCENLIGGTNCTFAGDNDWTTATTLNFGQAVSETYYFPDGLGISGVNVTIGYVGQVGGGATLDYSCINSTGDHSIGTILTGASLENSTFFLPMDCINASNDVTLKLTDLGLAEVPSDWHENFFTDLNSPSPTPTPTPSTTTGQAIYDILDSSGAGLGLLFQYLGKALPLLLIGLVLVVIIVLIGNSIFKHIFKSIQK